MQSVSSRIWTRIAVFISYGDNDYTTLEVRGKINYSVSWFVVITKFWSPLHRRGLENADSIPCRRGSWVYNPKLHLMVRLQFWISGECGVHHSLPSLQIPVCPELIVPVRIPSIGKIDLFKNYTYPIGIIIIISRCQHRSPWPYFTIPLYRPSLPGGLQG